MGKTPFFNRLLGHYVVITVDPRKALIGRHGSDVTIRFHPFSGQHFSVEYSTNFMAGHWDMLPGSDTVGNGRDVIVTDTNAVAIAGQRFYRIR